MGDRWLLTEKLCTVELIQAYHLLRPAPCQRRPDRLDPLAIHDEMLLVQVHDLVAVPDVEPQPVPRPHPAEPDVAQIGNRLGQIDAA